MDTECGEENTGLVFILSLDETIQLESPYIPTVQRSWFDFARWVNRMAASTQIWTENNARQTISHNRKILPLKKKDKLVFGGTPSSISTHPITEKKQPRCKTC